MNSLDCKIVVGTSFSASVVADGFFSGIDYCHDGRAKAGPYHDLAIVLAARRRRLFFTKTNKVHTCRCMYLAFITWQ